MIPERLRERHWEGFRQTMATGETKYGGETLSVPAVRADGARISVEFTVALVRDESGAVTGIAAIMRDVTAAWEERRALARRVRELEVGARGAARRGASGAPAGGRRGVRRPGCAGARRTGCYLSRSRLVETRTFVTSPVSLACASMTVATHSTSVCAAT